MTAGPSPTRDDNPQGPHVTEPNPTQERIDQEGPDTRPADVAWDEDRYGDPEPDED